MMKTGKQLKGQNTKEEQMTNRQAVKRHNGKEELMMGVASSKKGLMEKGMNDRKITFWTQLCTACFK